MCKSEEIVIANTNRRFEELRVQGMAKTKQRLGLFVQIEEKKNIVSFP
jgi:DNA-binding transcriptional regulator YhcF (GntR family)